MATRIKKNAAKMAKKIKQQMQAVRAGVSSYGQIDSEADDEDYVEIPFIPSDGPQTMLRVPISDFKPRHLQMQWIGDSAAQGGSTDEPEFTYLDRIREFASEFADVHPQSYDEWVAGFNGERYPDREIMNWYFISTILRIMTDKYDYDATQRKDCYQILSTFIITQRSIAINSAKEKSLLPSVQIEEIIKLHYGGKYTWKGYLMLTSIVY